MELPPADFCVPTLDIFIDVSTYSWNASRMSDSFRPEIPQECKPRQGSKLILIKDTFPYPWHMGICLRFLTTCSILWDHMGHYGPRESGTNSNHTTSKRRINPRSPEALAAPHVILFMAFDFQVQVRGVQPSRKCKWWRVSNEQGSKCFKCQLPLSTSLH